jgi:hypothetical protein
VQQVERVRLTRPSPNVVIAVLAAVIVGVVMSAARRCAAARRSGVRGG